MHAGELLSELRSRGVTLYPTAGGIGYEAPRGALTPELRAAIAARKAELLTVLRPPATDRRMSLGDCFDLIADVHASIWATYPAGALSVLDTDPDLLRRFRKTETRVDQLAATPGGPVETDFRHAVEAYAAVWRELIARFRAREERPDPMPELADCTRQG